MNRGRYVLLGLAPARAGWFDRLAHWTTAATIAAEFVKCVSAEEVRARLAGGRRHSALLIDGRTAALDRDVVDAARAVFTPVIVVGAATGSIAADLGAAAALPHDFDRDALLEILETHCQTIAAGDRLPPGMDDEPAPLWLGRLFSVCGAGGTGATTLAIALAQGVASDRGAGGSVLLADMARRADMAMLHDAVDLGPGLQDLVEAHRVGRPGPDEVRRFTFDVPRRGYRLLLGIRRPEDWSALRPRAFDASLDGIRRGFPVVVADVTGDFEGEAEGGSVDVEERNHAARASVLRSAVVVAVGSPGVKGVHSLAGVVRSLVELGVAPPRILPAVNRAPRNPIARAEISRALSSLLSAGLAPERVGSPLFVPERKVEDALRDGTELPTAIVGPLTRAVAAAAERQADAAPADVTPVRIAPGSLGAWPEAAEHSSGF